MGKSLRDKARQTQSPDAENRMSGGVGGATGAIPLARPDRYFEAASNVSFTAQPNVHYKQGTKIAQAYPVL